MAAVGAIQRAVRILPPARRLGASRAADLSRPAVAATTHRWRSATSSSALEGGQRQSPAVAEAAGSDAPAATEDSDAGAGSVGGTFSILEDIVWNTPKMHLGRGRHGSVYRSALGGWVRSACCAAACLPSLPAGRPLTLCGAVRCLWRV
eukprot:COSAG01_NODE_9896_length_2308_cov_6.269805_4_plen_149_part_00